MEANQNQTVDMVFHMIAALKPQISSFQILNYLEIAGVDKVTEFTKHLFSIGHYSGILQINDPNSYLLDEQYKLEGEAMQQEAQQLRASIAQIRKQLGFDLGDTSLN